MATIDIRRAHNLGVTSARGRAEQLARNLEGSLGVVWRWDQDCIRFHVPAGVAKGASGTVSVEETAVRVEIELPFMLRPLKGTVESKVHTMLAEALGRPA